MVGVTLGVDVVVAAIVFVAWTGCLEISDEDLDLAFAVGFWLSVRFVSGPFVSRKLMSLVDSSETLDLVEETLPVGLGVGRNNGDLIERLLF